MLADRPSVLHKWWNLVSVCLFYGGLMETFQCAGYSLQLHYNFICSVILRSTRQPSSYSSSSNHKMPYSKHHIFHLSLIPPCKCWIGGFKLSVQFEGSFQNRHHQPVIRYTVDLLFQKWSSGRRFRSIMTKASYHLNSFFPWAVSLTNRPSGP